MSTRTRVILAKAPAFAQQALLGHGGHQRAVAGEDETAGEAAGPGKIGAVVGVEQPVVGAKRAVKPERVVEAWPGLLGTVEIWLELLGAAVSPSFFAAVASLACFTSLTRACATCRWWRR